MKNKSGRENGDILYTVHHKPNSARLNAEKYDNLEINQNILNIDIKHTEKNVKYTFLIKRDLLAILNKKPNMERKIQYIFEIGSHCKSCNSSLLLKTE